ncbi:transcription termination factor NusA [Herbivorax sp. ANBcel31]|uniref:transcription termination factor NusA n=1 Tax=Herbivorax sp. ANBcel31 TaxID=3069754 RepID=UPI0027AEE1C0|nr:transcription termination factor NusA [Herbivorax sp. ANBcel31]MDQ2086899.1 transcription termination factor NusA [Herbivorax sp. ANBcel31]
MSADLIHALEQLGKEKGINKEILIEAIEAALISAYKRNFGSSQNVRVSIEHESGEFKVYALKKVTDDPHDDHSEISIENAKKINAELEEDDIVEIEVTPKKFGRIAAQTAKQVVVQRIREAERGIIFDEFSNKEEEIVTGIVQRTERKNVIIDLGKAEAILAPTEQVPGEQYRFNDRIKTYITEVKKTTKGPQIMVSRTHPGLVKRLFELEVPEIHEGIVELKSVSREPSSRTKIAVYSREDNVDPVGACVGQKGTRVQAIVDELRGEKIDIITWSSDPKEYISSSLSPAKVVRVEVNEEEKSAKVTVPDFQLSLAIGKEGQNARLAAKLTGWKIDIKSESQLRAHIEQQFFNFDDNYVYDEDMEEDGAEDNIDKDSEESHQEYNEEQYEVDNLDENFEENDVESDSESNVDEEMEEGYVEEDDGEDLEDNTEEDIVPKPEEV